MTHDQLEHSTKALLLALAARSLETGDHCPRVARLALDLGREIGLSGDELTVLKFGSLLHDVGKIKTPDAVLQKPDRLTEEEWATMREHPVTGANLLRALEYPEPVCILVEQHHERFDGEGYPFQLAGTQISIGARVFAIADTFDAIVNNRCYRAAASTAVALHEIDSWKEKQFDPQIVDVFVNLHSADRPVRTA